MARLVLRISALGSFLLGAIWIYRWEIVRAFFYDRGFRVMDDVTMDDFLHWGIPLLLVLLGGYLFWRTREAWPKAISTLINQSRDDLPDTRVADNARVCALFEGNERDKLFPLLEAEKITAWARPMKGDDHLKLLPGSTWRTHNFVFLPKQSPQTQNQTFVRLRQESVWFYVHLNQRQIERVWPELQWVPILTAAQIAFETAEEHGIENLISSRGQRPADKLSFCVDMFLNHDDHKIQIRGRKPPSSVLRLIPADEFVHLHHIPSTNSLGPLFPSESLHYDNVEILRADLNEHIAWIRELSRK